MTIQDFEDLNQELYFQEKRSVEREIKANCPDIDEIEDEDCPIKMDDPDDQERVNKVWNEVNI